MVRTHNIYKIKCFCAQHAQEIVYVGSTEKTLEQRLKAHFHSSKNAELKRKLFDHIREVGQNNFQIEEIVRIYQSEDNFKMKRVLKIENLFINYFGTLNKLNTVRAYLSKSEKARLKRESDLYYDRNIRDKEKAKEMRKKREQSNPNRFKCDQCNYSNYYQSKVMKHEKTHKHHSGLGASATSESGLGLGTGATTLNE